MKRSVYLLSLMMIFILVVNIDAGSHNRPQILESLKTHDISLQAVTWKAFDVYCSSGDTLSGFFKLTQDGDLFIGDQTKYDNWLLGGIDFLIMDQETFDSWSQGLPVDVQYKRNSITELSWSFDVPFTGKWYVIYFNDSIYIKQIEGSFTHTSPVNSAFHLILIALASTLVLGGLSLLRKKK